MVTGNLFVSKEQRKNKSQICDFSRYFSPNGKKLSRKCDCIGHNFEPWVPNFVVHNISKKSLISKKTVVLYQWETKTPKCGIKVHSWQGLNYSTQIRIVVVVSAHAFTNVAWVWFHPLSHMWVELVDFPLWEIFSQVIWFFPSQQKTKTLNLISYVVAQFDL